jgi:hypothetical protein
MKLLPAHKRFEEHVSNLGPAFSLDEAVAVWELGHAIAACWRRRILPTTEANIMMGLAADGLRQVRNRRETQEAQA